MVTVARQHLTEVAYARIELSRRLFVRPTCFPLYIALLVLTQTLHIAAGWPASDIEALTP
jgi:hypothetical protein